MNNFNSKKELFDFIRPGNVLKLTRLEKPTLIVIKPIKRGVFDFGVLVYSTRFGLERWSFNNHALYEKISPL